MTKKKKYFGTDGIRGKVGESPITPDFVMQLGWAAGQVFNRVEGAKILIGKDTRLSGYMFESALEAGLAASGVDVRLLGPMPTPAIGYLTRTFHAQAGIVISASHNSYEDNGIKFFSSEATKLDEAIELEIESYLKKPMTTAATDRIGKVARIEGARGRYIEFCKSTIPYSMDFAGLKVVLDCAHGATYHIAPAVFEELGANVTAIGTEPDGMNINYQCGSTSPELLQERVVEHQADLGIAFDGDGDRVIMVDHEGAVVDGDELLYVMAKDAMETGRMKGGVVGTLMSNFGLEGALSEMGLAFVRADVGDRYVMEQLFKYQWTLGGESSGHIVCLDKTTTGDGVISALQVVASMVRKKKTLKELKSGMHKYPQTLVNVRVNKKSDPTKNPRVKEALLDAEANLEGKGRTLLRMSGTEPVIRVMVEAENREQADALANSLAKVIESEMVGN